jgi:hypothetical protein
MENIKFYGINLGAVYLTIAPDLNDSLRTLLLILTCIYTGIQIYTKLNK